MSDLWLIIYEYAKDFYLNMDSHNLVDWGGIWTRMALFFYAATFLIVWIVVLGSLRRRAIRKTGLIVGKKTTRTVQQHFPLRRIDPAVFALRLGVDQSQLEQWQDLRTVDVEVDEQTDTKTITVSKR